MKKISILVVFTALLALRGYSQIITTIAGEGGIGCYGNGGMATNASFGGLFSISTDKAGNIYGVDVGCYEVFRINVAGVLTVLAGGGGTGHYSGDGGPATLASLYQPTGVAADSKGTVYIADNLNYRLRKIDTAGIITTIAGNGVSGYSGEGIPATDAGLAEPNDVVTDTAGNVYFSDGPGMIRKINSSGIITTIASLNYLILQMSIDARSNIYLSCLDLVPPTTRKNLVMKLSATGILSRIAGKDSMGYRGDGGPAINALLYGPGKVAADDAGNIYIPDAGNNCIRMVDASGIITTFAGDGTPGFSGDGGYALNCQLSLPQAMATDNAGNLLIADRGNNRIRSINTAAAVKALPGRASELDIYPNPSAGNFSLTMNAAVNEEVKMTITNVMGQVEKTLSGATNKRVEVSLTVPPGSYSLQAVTTSGQICSRQFVIN